MGKLGISIYPDKCNFEDDKKYLDLAHKYGFKRVFTSLLQIKGDTKLVVDQFKKIISYANSLDMEVIIDVNTLLAPLLDIDFSNLKFFSELGVYGVRFDIGYEAVKDALLTRNEYGLKVEFNMSMLDGHIDAIMRYVPDTNNLLGSFNFYPQRYTGLEYNHFKKGAKAFKKYALNTAAFVNSPSAEIGPWAMHEGICTLEDHRFLSIETQVRHLKMTGLVDDILIGNAYASEAELKAASEAFNESMPLISVDFIDEITQNERDSILNLTHLYRPDYSGYMIRSTWSRFLVKEKSFPQNNAVPIKRGDVIILNDNYGQYKGELQIALREMENPNRVNVVGHISQDNLILLESLKVCSNFKLIENTNE